MIPSVSIGLPVFNGERYIREALESLLHQTYTDFELVISDNASTDTTQSICREIAAKDQRVRYLRNTENIGLIANYNLVFRMTSGQYFKWASANDVCAPHMVEKCVQILNEQDDVVLCSCKTRLFTVDTASAVNYELGLNLMEDSAAGRLRHLVHRLRLNNGMNGVIRRRTLERTRLLDNYLASDVNLLVELALLGKFYEVPEYLFYRRVHPEELTASSRIEDLLKVYDPRSGKRVACKFWRLNWEHFRTVWRSSIPLFDKIRLYPFLTRKLFWDRRELWKEAMMLGRTNGKGTLRSA